VGLRLLADSEKTKARLTAEELADQVHPQRGPNWIDSFNDALIRQVVALALCDPNDVKKPFDLMPFPESDVSDAFTSRGAALVFEAIDSYEINSSPIGIAADRPELDKLAHLVRLVDPKRLPMPLRRMIGHVVGELDQLVDEDSVDAAGINDTGNEVAPVVS
jgi:hypothetical protein